jgi:hypothetical protein
MILAAIERLDNEKILEEIVKVSTPTPEQHERQQNPILFRVRRAVWRGKTTRTGLREF